MVLLGLFRAPLQDAPAKEEAGIPKGNSIIKSLMENPLFDSRIISLAKVEEETIQTEYIFQQLSVQYNQELVQQSRVMTKVLEPLIILFVGILVVVLLMVMYLSMFQFSSAIW